MTYINEYDRDGECAERGTTTEKLFLSVLKRKDPKAHFGNHQEDTLNKIDIESPKYGSYDVKGRKKVSRGRKIQDDYIWIEFQNVTGHRGWLYGDADFIAFERESDFVVIPRKILIKVCYILVDKERYVV